MTRIWNLSGGTKSASSAVSSIVPTAVVGPVDTLAEPDKERRNSIASVGVRGAVLGSS